MKKEKYLSALKELYPNANINTIKVWSSTPKYIDIIRGVELVKKSGNNVVYYTCELDDSVFIEKIKKDFSITIYSHNDYIMECLSKKRWDLLEIIENKVY